MDLSETGWQVHHQGSFGTWMAARAVVDFDPYP